MHYLAMIKWLKRYFVPNTGNAYRPQFLFRENLRQLLGIVLVFELIVFILPSLYFTNFVQSLNLGAVLPGVLSTLTNEERAGINLPTLTESPILNQVAQLKAEDMASKGYFAHNSPEGKTPWYWFAIVGYTYSSAGENLAVNFSDSEDVTSAWMDSPAHRSNIVAGHYTEIGTGIATGVYKGEKTIFVAQVYAKPVVISAPVLPQNIVTVPTPVRAPQSSPLIVQETQVLGEAAETEEIVPVQEEVNPIEEPTLIDKSLSSPHNSANAILYVTLSIILVALFMNITIKFDEQHPDLITNGMVAAVVIFALYLSNGYIADKNMETSFLAFSTEQAGE